MSNGGTATDIFNSGNLQKSRKFMLHVALLNKHP